MKFYLYRHTFIFSAMATCFLCVMLWMGGFPFGLSLFLNAIVWGGLVGIALVHFYFQHRNIWILFFNLQISRARHLISAFIIFVIICCALVFLFGESLGL